MLREIDPDILIVNLDKEVQKLFKIKESCNLVGLQDVVLGATTFISDFDEIRDTSVVTKEQEKEFNDIQSEYYSILEKLQKCRCFRKDELEAIISRIKEYGGYRNAKTT